MQPGEARRWNLALTAGLEWDSNPTVAGSGIKARDDGRGVYRIRGTFRVEEHRQGKYLVSVYAMDVDACDEVR